MRQLRITHGANLPHWTAEGAIYAVTFRLADSLPAARLEQWRRELQILENKILTRPGQMLRTEAERTEYLLSEKIQTFLDSGAGQCYLRNPVAAKIVADALAHFQPARYSIFAWCIMPNHVHAVLQPQAQHRLESILHSWKSFTATQINRHLSRTGSFWQKESYDHLIRDEADFKRSIQYVLDNPVNAGLKHWPWVGTGFQEYLKS